VSTAVADRNGWRRVLRPYAPLGAKKLGEGEVKVKVDSAFSFMNYQLIDHPLPLPQTNKQTNKQKQQHNTRQNTTLTPGAKLQSSKQKTNRKLNTFSKHIKELTILKRVKMHLFVPTSGEESLCIHKVQRSSFEHE